MGGWRGRGGKGSGHGGEAAKGCGYQKGSGGKGKERDAKGGKGGKGGGAGRGGSKPSDDPSFVQLQEGSILKGSRKATYTVESYVASGTFSRVFRVRESDQGQGEGEGHVRRRWGAKSASSGGTAEMASGEVFAAKVMRTTDAYIQYTSDACKEGDLLQRLEKAQQEQGKDVLTMRCVDSFACCDDVGEEYWCLILEWLDASLFDVVKANRHRGLHLSMVRVLLKQLLEQLRVLQELDCTHTDIKHKNCCLADTSYFLAPAESGEQPQVILANPLAKFIDYGNAVFEGEPKTHPIHTKQFRAPEVLLNVSQGWGPPSDTWTLGVTAAFLVSGRLIFNSHEPQELVRAMVEALGPFPPELLESAKDGRLRRTAEAAAAAGRPPALAEWLGLAGPPAAGRGGASLAADSPEGRCADLIRRMLAPWPGERIGAAEALRHPFIALEEPLAPERPKACELRRLALAAR